MKRVQYVNGESPWIGMAERSLKKDGAVELIFVNQKHWATKKQEIYRQFKNYDITIQEKGYTKKDKIHIEKHVLITREMIRTNRIQPGKGIAAANLSFPVELPVPPRGSIAEFDDMYLCACCGKYLPDKTFAHRSYHGNRYRQSYCRPCMHLYNTWRTAFLKEKGIVRLTPGFNAGYKQRNEYFRTWYEARQRRLNTKYIHFDEMVRIVKCRHCDGYEYFGEMRWLNGRCACRSCYKGHREELDRRLYDYTDLDGPKPTEADFLAQEDRYCEICHNRECTGCEHQH